MVKGSPDLRTEWSDVLNQGDLSALTHGFQVVFSSSAKGLWGTYANVQPLTRQEGLASSKSQSTLFDFFAVVEFMGTNSQSHG